MENRTDARDRVNALSTGTKILVPAAVLLLIDLFLSWQKACVDTPIGDVCGSASGWDGFWGILTGLLTIALLIWVGLQIAGVDLSGANLPVSNAMITLGLGVLVFVAALIKLLTILGDESSWPAYIGILLAAATAYGAYQRSRDVEDSPASSSGGMGSSYGDTGSHGSTTHGRDVGGTGATTSTSGTTATTTDVARDDVEPMPRPADEPPRDAPPRDAPPRSTHDDR